SGKPPGLPRSLLTSRSLTRLLSPNPTRICETDHLVVKREFCSRAVLNPPVVKVASLPRYRSVRGGPAQQVRPAVSPSRLGLFLAVWTEAHTCGHSTRNA